MKNIHGGVLLLTFNGVFYVFLVFLNIAVMKVFQGSSFLILLHHPF